MFGYEEAWATASTPPRSRDKDGIAAALLIVELVAALHAQGRTVHDVLDELARAHGLHATDQLSVRVGRPVAHQRRDGRLRDAPPAALGGRRGCASTTSAGSGALPPDRRPAVRASPRGRACVVRPSGTEPKLKCYLEVVVPVVADGDVDVARVRAADRLPGCVGA